MCTITNSNHYPLRRQNKSTPNGGDENFNKLIERIKKENPELMYNPDILPYTRERFISPNVKGEFIEDKEKFFGSNWFVLGYSH